jgi:hypothetical protein
VTAARTAAVVACVLFAAAACSSAKTETSALDPIEDPAGYAAAVGTVENVNAATLLELGRTLCDRDYLADFDEGDFFDHAGITGPARERITDAAHQFLC